MSRPSPRLTDPSLRPALYRWFREPLGRRLLQAEREQLDSILPDVFGYHAVQVGAPSGDDLLGATRIPHRVILDPDPSNSAGPVLAAEPEALPFRSDSVDALVLHHTLEFSRYPHDVLREAERTLVGEGHAIIVGFDPWSAWGLWRLLAGWRGHAPWSGRFFARYRLKDWLLLLGFEIVACRPFFLRPPVRNEVVLDRFGFLERLNRPRVPLPAGIYVLVARKKVFGMTPLKPRWRPRRGIFAPAPGMPEPTPRRRHRER